MGHIQQKEPVPKETVRNKIYEEVQAIIPLDSLEAQHQTDVLSWLDSDAEICRTQKPATPPKHLVSYFVLVDYPHILLVNHKKANLWLPTGGHVETREHPRETALREAQEELGIRPAFLLEKPLMLTSTQTVGTTAGHIDVSLWYVMQAYKSEILEYDSKEFKGIQWFHYNDIPLSQSDPHMARFLVKLHSAVPIAS